MGTPTQLANYPETFDQLGQALDQASNTELRLNLVGPAATRFRLMFYGYRKALRTQTPDCPWLKACEETSVTIDDAGMTFRRNYLANEIREAMAKMKVMNAAGLVPSTPQVIEARRPPDILEELGYGKSKPDPV